ncbi:MAG: NAD(P)-binding domain-containing protein, partial [Sedimenticola sp.]|nr:NAD(P)-binding domain-containing protein [Sedimenticola sp.]
MTTERIALVGAGAAGGALVLALYRAGYPIEGIASRSIESARRCAERTGTVLASDDPARVV